eukprot:CAMPEP_0185731126 /NCGR_PEP_ID=MMETSP1171-20130828/11938_1 /TAXON_ID=374046 /ORGANISM="Helicotheca tamensis, Strain CCMP826" /LENGTH=578 /DNA_ID=CAMNT_0028400321 /DNA_START=85 /DNA_END=1821 /DNA_ORIENTATION=-
MLPPCYKIPMTLTDRQNIQRKNNNTFIGPSSSAVRSRLPMKSSPYVGWFRHAPPITNSRVARSSSFNCARRDLRMRGNNKINYFNSSSKMKTSPYIGWFRHAPPSRHHQKKRSYCSHHLSLESIIAETASFKDKNSKFSSSCTCHHHNAENCVHVDGRLPGGAPLHNNNNNNNFSKDGDNDHFSSPTSATLSMLNKLASWFLFPLAHDELGSAIFGGEDEHSIYCGVSMGVSAIMMPFMTSLLRRTSMLEDGTNRSLLEQQQQQTQHQNDDVDENSYHEDGLEMFKEEDATSSSESSGPLDVSVSSLAQAYYAHQVSKGLVEQETEYQERMDDSQHRLDYVITQMDIARMVRNASRHLDVESILSLPTVVYQGNKCAPKDADAVGSDGADVDGVGSPTSTQGVNAAHVNKPNEKVDKLGEWSWMMVSTPPPDCEENTIQEDDVDIHPEAKTGTNKLGQTLEEEKQTDNTNNQEMEEQHQNPQEFCVICLEHFQEGDKLRVLPCDHLFHIGCIDKWLSGAHSHEECFTSGCPTCKKRPDYIAQQEKNDVSVDDSSCPTDGSVPSWAFAKLGDALANEGV